MADKLSVMDIVYSTSTDGVGLRNSLYVAGCPHRCPGCHNHESWDINNGIVMTIQEVFDKLNEDSFNISIVGGEPLFQHESVLNLCKKIKAETNKNIWLYTGYWFEEVIKVCPDILNYIDVLVDGRFNLEERKKNPNPIFRGDQKQRIINVPKTLETNILTELIFI